MRGNAPTASNRLKADKGESRLVSFIKIKKGRLILDAVRIVHMEALSVYPNAVIRAAFCANRWAEEFSNHSRCSMGHRPNDFILKFSPGSIVIRFLVSLTLLKFVYGARVWWRSPPQDKGIPTKSRSWRFDGRQHQDSSCSRLFPLPGIVSTHHPICFRSSTAVAS